MDLSSFYLTHPHRLAPMKVFPKRTIIPAELPILTALHLRSSLGGAGGARSGGGRTDSTTVSPQMSSPSPSRRSTVGASFAAVNNNTIDNSYPLAGAAVSALEQPPRQSLATMLAIAAAKANKQMIASATTTASTATRCALHPSTTLCEEGTSLADADEMSELFDSDARRMRYVLRVQGVMMMMHNHNSNAGDDASSDGSSATKTTATATATTTTATSRLMSHWNETIARPFVTQTGLKVSTFLEVWVFVPFDSLLKRFLATVSACEEDDPSARHNLGGDDPLLSQDFIDFALASRSGALGRTLMSHLVGDCAESGLSVKMAVFQCRIVPRVLSPPPSSLLFNGSGNSTDNVDDAIIIPEIVESHDAVDEWRAMQKWLAGSRLEMMPSVEQQPLWIFSTENESAMTNTFLAEKDAGGSSDTTSAELRQQQQDQQKQRRRQREEDEEHERADDDSARSIGTDNVDDDDAAFAFLSSPLAAASPSSPSSPSSTSLHCNERCSTCRAELFRRITPYKHCAPWVAWAAIATLLSYGAGPGFVDRGYGWFHKVALTRWWLWRRTITLSKNTTKKLRRAEVGGSATCNANEEEDRAVNNSVKKEDTATSVVAQPPSAPFCSSSLSYLPSSVMVSAAALKFLRISLQQQPQDHSSKPQHDDVKLEHDDDAPATKKQEDVSSSSSSRVVCKCSKETVVGRFRVLSPLVSAVETSSLALHFCPAQASWIFEFQQEGNCNKDKKNSTKSESVCVIVVVVPHYQLRVNVSHTFGSKVTLFGRSADGSVKFECTICDLDM